MNLFYKNSICFFITLNIYLEYNFSFLIFIIIYIIIFLLISTFEKKKIIFEKEIPEINLESEKEKIIPIKETQKIKKSKEIKKEKKKNNPNLPISKNLNNNEKQIPKETKKTFEIKDNLILKDTIIKGIQFRGIKKEYFNTLEAGDEILLELEENNKFDKTAIKTIIKKDNKFIGYLSKNLDFKKELMESIKKNKNYKCSIRNIIIVGNHLKDIRIFLNLEIPKNN